MPDRTDHTVAIFTALGITPETQPWAYYLRTSDGWYRGLHDYMSENVLSFDDIFENYSHDDFSELSLLSGTLEADGLAVRLCDIADIPLPVKNKRWQTVVNRKMCRSDNFAQAVHDALCEALEINNKGEKNDNHNHQ